MLSAFTSALITQIMNNCSATRENYCVWTTEARKLLTLLYWMATHRAGDSSVAEMLLTWISPESNSDKSQQMAGALVLFELIQRHRQRIFVTPTAEPMVQREPSLSSLLDSLSSEFIRQLIQLTRQSSIVNTTDNSTKRLKVTKLGLVALEALIAVLCDQAAWLSEASQASSSSPHIQNFLEGVAVAISTLQQYHTTSSARKKFLLLALNQLSQYTEICRATMARTSSAASEAIEMVCWHWNASAMLLCTRSETVLRIRKTKPLVALKTAILRSSADNNMELLAARLRRLCILLSLTTGSRGNTLIDELSQDLEAKGKLLLLLVRALKASIEQKNQLLLVFATQLIHTLVLHEGGYGSAYRPKQLLETEEDWRALLSLLLHTFKNAIVVDFAATGATKERSLLRSLEQLIAEVAIQSKGIFLLTELQRYLRSTDMSSVLVRALYINILSSLGRC